MDGHPLQGLSAYCASSGATMSPCGAAAMESSSQSSMRSERPMFQWAAIPMRKLMSSVQARLTMVQLT